MHRQPKINFLSKFFQFFVSLPAVVDGEDCIKLEYTVSYFDAGKGWTLVDDTSTCSDGCSTCEVFSTLNGTASMDCDITVSECIGMELFCNIETNAINLNRDLRCALISISSFRQDVECLKKIKQCFRLQRNLRYIIRALIFKLTFN